MPISHIQDKPGTHMPDHGPLTVGSAASEKFLGLIQVHCPHLPEMWDHWTAPLRHPRPMFTPPIP